MVSQLEASFESIKRKILLLDDRKRYSAGLEECGAGIGKLKLADGEQLNNFKLMPFYRNSAS